MNLRPLVVAALSLSLLAAACGDSSSSDTTESTTTTTDATTTTSATTSTDADPDRVVAEGDAISVHYIGTLEGGEIFDASRERGSTLDFTVGAGQMIPGFDAAVRGMTAGEIKTVRLAPADAYRDRSEDLVVEVPLDQVPEGTQAGDELVSSNGQTVVVVEVRPDDDIVLLDLNHPLAGQFLTFEIEIISIG